MKYDPTAQYLPPPRFQDGPKKSDAQKIIHYWIKIYRLTDPDGLPLTKWLMDKSGYSSGSVSKHRASFFSVNENLTASADSYPQNPC